MEDDDIVVAQITITPVGTESADITGYIKECIKIAHLSEMKFQETPLGTVVRGPMDEIMTVVEKMHEAPFDMGANRVRTTVIIDDYRQEEPETSFATAAAQEIALEQERYDS
jgi:uncharacterized protein (TIGR00106 family)